MTNEKKKEFTLKITEANSSQMIVVLYDITLEYIGEAYQAKDEEAFLNAVNNAKRCIVELKKSARINTELGANYYSLYTYFYKQMSRAIASNKIECLEICEKLITSLRETWIEVAKKDCQDPIMSNSEKLYAGYTYNKNSINENSSAFNNRGFLV